MFQSRSLFGVGVGIGFLVHVNGHREATPECGIAYTGHCLRLLELIGLLIGCGFKVLFGRDSVM